MNSIILIYYLTAATSSFCAKDICRVINIAVSSIFSLSSMTVAIGQMFHCVIPEALDHLRCPGTKQYYQLGGSGRIPAFG